MSENKDRTKVYCLKFYIFDSHIDERSSIYNLEEKQAGWAKGHCWMGWLFAECWTKNIHEKLTGRERCACKSWMNGHFLCSPASPIFWLETFVCELENSHMQHLHLKCREYQNVVCKVLLEKKVSISIKRLSRRKHQLLEALSVDGCIDSGFDKTQFTNTSMAP